MKRIKQCFLYNVIMRFTSFYKNDTGIFFGKRDNAMMFWFGVFAFTCVGMKIYQMWCVF